jgi:hypothetical protein
MTFRVPHSKVITYLNLVLDVSIEIFTCMVCAYEFEDLYTSLQGHNQLHKPVIRKFSKR